jgi:class 3 adenylate cyclase
MNLVARIEKITPPDEIYLTHAAWMLVNKAEVQTTFVGEFSLEGVAEPEQIFKVEQRSRTKILSNQFILLLDIRGWVAYVKSHSLAAAEHILMQLDDLVNQICIDHEGVVRNAMGDSYLLSFVRVSEALAAVEGLYCTWDEAGKRQGIGLAMGIHIGDFNILRSYIFGEAIIAASQLVEVGKIFWPSNDVSYVVVSKAARDKAQVSRQKQVLLPLAEDQITDGRLRTIAEEYGAYQLVVGRGQRRAFG